MDGERERESSNSYKMGKKDKKDIFLYLSEETKKTPYQYKAQYRYSIQIQFSYAVMITLSVQVLT